MLNILAIVIIVISLFLGFFIFAKSPKTKVNIYFGLMVLFMSLWASMVFFVDSVKDLTSAELIIKTDFASGIIFSSLFLLFVAYFPRQIIKVSIKDYLITVPAIILAIASYFGMIVGRIQFTVGGTEVGNGPLFYLYTLILVVYLIVGLIILIYKTKIAKDLEKSQLVLILMGLGISILIALISIYILPGIFIQHPNITRLGGYSIIFFIAFTAYAIVKKRLFDIRVIVTETATILVLFALFVQILFSQTQSERLVNIGIFLIVSYGGYLLIKSVQEEIKRRKQLQTLSTQLAHANEHLKELDKMKTEFVSLASHELLTPVSAIEGYLSMLLDEKLAKVDDPKAKDYLDHVYRSAKRLARLVADMLNVSRIEEGRLLVQKQEVNLTEIIKQVIDEIRFKAEENKQKIVFANSQFLISNFQSNPNDKMSNDENSSRQGSNDNDSEEEKDRHAIAHDDNYVTFGDPDKIKEIIVNLIGNSIKYSKNPGEIKIEIEKVPTEKVQEKWSEVEAQIKDRPLDDQEAIKSTVDEKLMRLVGENQILIKVIDQGVGIPKDELPKLFKKFHRVGDCTTAESQGTGLGLYISRALVELHHGRIWADSEGQGHGSTFTFSLPEATSKHEIESLEAQAPQNKEQLKPLAKPMKNAEEL